MKATEKYFGSLFDLSPLFELNSKKHFQTRINLKRFSILVQKDTRKVSSKFFLSRHDQWTCLAFPPQSSVTLGHCEYNWDINLVDQDLIGS